MPVSGNLYYSYYCDVGAEPPPLVLIYGAGGMIYIGRPKSVAFEVILSMQLISLGMVSLICVMGNR